MRRTRLYVWHQTLDGRLYGEPAYEENDEYVMLPGHFTVTRLSGRATLDELASRGPGTDHKLYGPAKLPEELHRLTVRRPKPADTEAWKEHCPRPKDWSEQ